MFTAPEKSCHYFPSQNNILSSHFLKIFYHPIFQKKIPSHSLFLGHPTQKMKSYTNYSNHKCFFATLLQFFGHLTPKKYFQPQPSINKNCHPNPLNIFATPLQKSLSQRYPTKKLCLFSFPV